MFISAKMIPTFLSITPILNASTNPPVCMCSNFLDFQSRRTPAFGIPKMATVWLMSCSVRTWEAQCAVPPP